MQTAVPLSPCLDSKASGLGLGSGTVVAPSGGIGGKQKNWLEGSAANITNMEMTVWRRTVMLSRRSLFCPEAELTGFKLLGITCEVRISSVSGMFGHKKTRVTCWKEHYFIMINTCDQCMYSINGSSVYCDKISEIVVSILITDLEMPGGIWALSFFVEIRSQSLVGLNANLRIYVMGSRLSYRPPKLRCVILIRKKKYSSNMKSSQQQLNPTTNSPPFIEPQG